MSGVVEAKKTADHKEFWFRRIHSLTGFAPLCIFLVVHFIGNTNSTMRDGGAAFNEYATKLHENPFINMLELGVILPLFYHAFYGLYRMVTKEKWNAFAIRNESNMRYFLQRVTGIILLVFLASHIYNTRFQQLMGTPVDYNYMAEYLGTTGTFAFYVLGVASACYHFGNGLWGFLITWGITTGRRAQAVSAKVCIAVSVALFLLGMNAMLGFFDAGVSFNF